MAENLYVCGDCGHEQNSSQGPCPECHGERIVLISMIIGMFGENWRAECFDEAHVTLARCTQEQRSWLAFFFGASSQGTQGWPWTPKFEEVVDALVAKRLVERTNDHCHMTELGVRAATRMLEDEEG